MFIGHLPSGYGLTRMLLKWTGPWDQRTSGHLLRIGLVASVLPDIDLVYFYWIDQRQHLHHTYWTHLPVFWGVVFSCLLMTGWWVQQRTVIHSALIGFANVMLHLALDSVASRIHWFYPISMTGFGLCQVPSRYAWWVWNYIFHWTFSFELMFVIMAVYMLYWQRHGGVTDPCRLGRRRPANKPKRTFSYAGHRTDRRR